MAEYVIADLSHLRVWDAYLTREAAEKDLPEVCQKQAENAKNCLENHEKYGYDDRDPYYWLKQSESYKNHQYKVMTWEEYEQGERDHYLAMPVTEVTEEKFFHMLEVLPPMNWGDRDGFNSFFMCEFLHSTYTEQYARREGRFYCKVVDYRDPSTWIKMSEI